MVKSGGWNDHRDEDAAGKPIVKASLAEIEVTDALSGMCRPFSKLEILDLRQAWIADDQLAHLEG